MSSSLLEHEQQLHSEGIQQWVAAVEKRHNDFSKRMDTYKKQLESTLGIQNRQPKDDMTTSSQKDKIQHREINEEKRKSARKRE